MAEGGGQKPIRNTLLSAATGASFFEEAAMLIPVPLVEPESQEPATAEIDLNSDDSCSNRASVEKEFADTLTLGESGGDEVQAISLDEPEPAAPISLFSRAATGMDAFSRMLAGGIKTEAVTKHEITLDSGRTPPPLHVVADSSALPPSILNLQAQPPPQNHAQPSLLPSTLNTNSVSPTLVSSSVTLVTTSSPQEEEEEEDGHIASASSIFSSGPGSPSSTASIFSTNSNSVAAAFPPPPTATPPSSAFATVKPSTTNNRPFHPGETGSLNMTLPSTVPLSTPTSSMPLIGSALPPAVTPLTGPTFASVSYATSTATLPPTQTMSLSNVPLVSPTSVTTPSIPPASSGAGNAFRLGAQRMKYVPCPEMQATPQVQSPLYRPPDVLSPPVNPTGPVAQPQTFSPGPSMGSVLSSPPRRYADMSSPVVGNFSGEASPSLPVSHPLNANVFPPPHPGLVGSGVSPYSPQELPPLTYHWFYRKDVDGKAVWKPFSIIDSVALEDAFAHARDRLVPTDGGRYDVCVQKRLKTPVYWEETPIEVRRGSWFFKGPMDNRFIPYDEEFALKLEHEYADCMRTGGWQKRLEFPDGESVIMHSAGVVVHFCQAAAPDDWGNLPESQLRPRVVKRGVEEIEMEDGESTQIDHLVFVVHGIGPICDFKLRNIVEAVDDFRGLSIQLLNSHFRESIDRNLVGRVEFLPVSWHKSLHGDKGIDEQLKRITLRSIPKFRDFTNDTLLDILFYTSPVYCQTIINSVGSELNRLYKLFLSRNPSFRGKVSLTGHSLGSLILFDLLAHQPLVGSRSETNVAVAGEEAKDNLDGKESPPVTDATVSKADISLTSSSSSRTVSYTVGTAGTGQPFINYPSLEFAPTAFFALGSPIAMFVTVRGIEELGTDFRFPTCNAFFNIFHPYDPVAYRIETLIDPNFQSRPVLIPHHKGRKRIHLELKETMARVGADIKHKVIDAVKNTLNTVSYYTGFSKNQENLENEIQSAIQGEMEKSCMAYGADDENAHLRIGCLNGGRRIDHVLQEAPYETFNEYVFAMSTHVGYWESEDTMLLILTEIYGTMGVQRDLHVTGAQQQQQQTVVSPTHTQHATISQAVTSSMHFSSVPAYGQPLYTTGYQPSAPPASENQFAWQNKSQGLYNGSTTASVPMSVQSQTQIPPQSVPMITPASQTGGVLLPPNPPVLPAGSSVKPPIIGNRPVADPNYFPRGMDPTAPMITMSQVGPPPKVGFVPKQN